MGTTLVTSKPCHFESNGDIERMNLTVEEKVKNGCMRINQYIGHILFHSISSNAIPRYTGILLDRLLKI